MIHLHPNFPKDSLNKQQLILHRCPRYSVEPDNLIVKDSQYLNTSSNLWNNPYRATKKSFEDVHRSNQQAEKIIKQQKELNNIIKSKEHKSKLQNLASQRNWQLSRLNDRKNERISIQQLSSQIDPQQDNIVTSKKHNKLSQSISGRPAQEWNKINGFCKKMVGQLINPTIIRMDEQGVQNILKKMTDDEKLKQMKEDLRMANKNKIRSKFLTKHQANFEFEQQIGLVPPRKIIESNFNQYNSLEDDFRLIFTSQSTRNAPFNQKFVSTNEDQSQKSSNIVQLANPKNFYQRKEYNLKNPLEKTEFKGMYMAEVDFLNCETETNEFTKTMMIGSPVLRMTINERPSTRYTKQSQRKNRIQNSNIKKEQEDEINVIDEIQDFEKKISHQKRKVGFPRTTLLQLD